MSAAPLAVLAAGGTGGHIFPAEALAEELLGRGWRVTLVTDGRGQAFGGRLGDVTVHRVRSAAVLGRGIFKRLGALAQIGLGVLQARFLLMRLKPAVVVGFGGYSSVPTMFAANQAGLPTMVHEQNAVLGRANRVLAPRARRIATSFTETRGVRPADAERIARTGNPVRGAVLALAGNPYPTPSADGPLRLLVTGGSQGARVFADVVPSAIASLPRDMRDRLEVSQQCRPEDLERTRSAYAAADVRATVDAFFTDMPARLAVAHLAICRAGASTVAELAVAGLPAILVPLPSAADDHQTVNARLMETAGAAWVVPQPDFTAPALARRLFNLLRDGDRLSQAAASARQAAMPDAARRLADLVQELEVAA